MLGCQDFCGYYEWTFHYLRRRFGKDALLNYWADAIAADSQQHYLEAAQLEGLRGLYNSWSKTGVEEECDWTVTLDESNNNLRLDMRQCPSKGCLLDRDLNAALNLRPDLGRNAPEVTPVERLGCRTRRSRNQVSFGH